ncbi:MAG TPA: type II secretion system protein [Parachlamydiaceae bacterium]|nr:type II secretion system protein [Parachlamydiaceae bacterium]
MKPLSYCSRRPIVLLEVLIAFALIALCILPLIYPHVFILRSEKKFISTVELDHTVNLLYADRLQKLYQNEISWQDIENGAPIPITPAMVEAAGVSGDFPFTGTYQFIKKRQKPKDPKDKSAYVFSLEFSFMMKPGYFLEKDTKEENKFIYIYQVPVERIL